jgi:ferrous iron transport protein B
MIRLDEPVVLLIGQPNCGKSTLFNAMAGHKAETSNFPGTTVQHAHSRVAIGGRIFNLIDLPGTYSLNPSDPAEKIALTHLFHERPDILINVVDASILGRSLELTLELLDMGLPMIVVLNMSDLAEKKGVRIEAQRLSARLGVPVVPTVGVHGRGIGGMIEAVFACLDKPCRPSRSPRWSSAVEDPVSRLEAALPEDFPCVANRRFTAVQMIETGDSFCASFLEELRPDLKRTLDEVRTMIERSRGLPAYEAVAAERHHLAQKIVEEATSIRRNPSRSGAERLDDVLMHPILGYPILAAVLLGFFGLIFKIGGPLETLMLKPMTGLKTALAAGLGDGLVGRLADGLLQGLGGGAAIVLPYFLPLLLLMAILEDSGYLARAGFLLDTFMHRIGLHGKSVAPFILGFGCNVPAVTATRILESRRDRVLTSLLIPFIPCSARTTIILALIAFFLGPLGALGFYAGNILLLAVIGRILSAFFKDDSPGLILEIPSLKVPRPKSVLIKVYLQLKSFVRFAWPLLIGGSVLLSLIQYLGWDRLINVVLRPLTTGLLGLPAALGVTLIFGFLRKELSLLMMLQALGVAYADLPSVISTKQMIVFTVFVSLFIPCLSTLAMLAKESGRKIALASAALSFVVAVLVSAAVRLIF